MRANYSETLVAAIASAFLIYVSISMKVDELCAGISDERSVLIKAQRHARN
jgi:hypothetical protein